jgi:NADPH:quinone reductase-like Zn-dependent oxidoreductase
MSEHAMTSLELRSTITSAGELRLSLDEVDVGEPGPDEIVVRVEAAPLNPSDLGLLLGPADLSTLKAIGSDKNPTLVAQIPQDRLRMLHARFDQSLAVGNEGAGTVVAAGANSHALLGEKVAMLGGAMYTQYRRLPKRDCIVLPNGVTPAQGASMFVNPLTALAMLETMRREGHKALVHTAAASNLGQMLNRICLAEGVSLVNIVRSPAQAVILRNIGARYIVDSASPDFRSELTDVIAATGATLAFDAVGGGRLANRILHAMEAAIGRTSTGYSRYGSAVLKRVYIYGGLDLSPTELDRGFGMAWSVGGFLLPNFLQSIGVEATLKLRERVVRELTTTFASHYTATISQHEALRPEVVLAYAKKSTGEKYLIDPSRP